MDMNGCLEGSYKAYPFLLFGDWKIQMRWEGSPRDAGCGGHVG